MVPLDVLAFGSVAAFAGGWLAHRPGGRGASGWRLPVEADFSSLEEREPLLAALLESATVEDRPHHVALSLEPWDGGTLRNARGRFRHRGMFFEPRDGTVCFLFVLESVDDESTMTFAGAIGRGGRRISYSILRRTTRNALGERVERIWEDGQ
jgi:hypothetical protein